MQIFTGGCFFFRHWLRLVLWQSLFIVFFSFGAMTSSLHAIDISIWRQRFCLFHFFFSPLPPPSFFSEEIFSNYEPLTTVVHWFHAWHHTASQRNNSNKAKSLSWNGTRVETGRSHGESKGTNSACGFLFITRFAHAARHCFNSGCRFNSGTLRCARFFSVAVLVLPACEFFLLREWTTTCRHELWRLDRFLSNFVQCGVACLFFWGVPCCLLDRVVWEFFIVRFLNLSLRKEKFSGKSSRSSACHFTIHCLSRGTNPINQSNQS